MWIHSGFNLGSLHRSAGWTSLEYITLIGVKEVKYFFTVHPDGSFKAKPMIVHLRMFKAFILFYTQKIVYAKSTQVLSQNDVLLMTKQVLNWYCESDKYNFDLAISGVNETLEETTPSVSGNSVADMTMLLTTPVCQGSLERKTENYEDLNYYEDYIVWNEDLHRTLQMHITHHILDESYEPSTNEYIMDFKEMQDFMFLHLKDPLKTNKGQLLVSQFESTRVAQRPYRKLKEHAMHLTVVHLSVDTSSR
jgi:hypothetical protein